jgi:cell wall-associated NlpC family hydrolase
MPDDLFRHPVDILCDLEIFNAALGLRAINGIGRHLHFAHRIFFDAVLKVGFDCSGFITYVFNHFGVAVPRSSIDFTNVGKAVSPEQAKPGDLILFTGTDPIDRFVGHMGIVVENGDSLRFIHSTSGKAMGVTTTPLNEYYKKRYVKTIRIFPQND